MKDFVEIYRTYYDSNNFFAGKEARARTPNSRERWARKSQLNDYAYFVLLFAQLEDYINEQCKKLVNKKQTASSWKRKRLWDTVDIEKMNFMRLVALLAEKGGTLYNKIGTYYTIRCKIAHGDSSQGQPIHIPTVITEFKNFKKILKP